MVNKKSAAEQRGKCAQNDFLLFFIILAEALIAAGIPSIGINL